MGFWDKIEGAVKATAHAGHVAGSAINPFIKPIYALPAGLAMDIVTSPWNDDASYNGFLNTLESRAMARIGDTLEPLDLMTGHHGGAILHELGAASRQVYSYGVTRPMTTVLGAAGQPGGEDHAGAFLNPANWRDAWNASRDLSPGQQAYAGIGGGVGSIARGVGAGGLLPDATTLPGGGVAHPVTSPAFDVTSAADRTAFHHGVGKYASGAADLAVSWNYDPLVLAGKGASALRRAKVVQPITAATDVSKAIDSNRIDGFVNELMRRTPDQRIDWLARNPTISGPRASDDGTAIMHLLANAKDAHHAKAILRDAIDPNPRNATVLRLASAADHDAAMLIRDVRIPTLEGALRGPAGQDPISVWRQRALADANAKADNLEQSGDYKAFQARSVAALRAVPRVTVPQRVGDAIAEHTGTTWAVYQPSRYNVPMRVLKSATTMRAGVIDRNRPSEGYTQLKRLLDRAGHGFETLPVHRDTAARLGYSTREGGLSAEEKGVHLQAWAKATTEAEQNKVILDAEQAVVMHYGARLGVDAADAQKIINEAQYRRGKAQTLFSPGRAYTGARDDSGRLIDHLDGAGVGEGGYALMETQLANHFPLIDVDQIGKIMATHQATLVADRGGIANRIAGARGSEAVEFGAGALDEVLTKFNRVWKPAQLMRLGWTIRVVTDEQLRIMAAVGAMAHLPMVAHSLMSPNSFQARESELARQELARFESEVATRRALHPDAESHITAEELATRKTLEKAAGGRRKQRAAKFTQGMEIRDANGRVVRVEGALGGEEGSIYSDLASSTGNLDRESQLAGAFGELADRNGRYLNGLRADAGRPVTILPVPTSEQMATTAGRKAHEAQYTLGWERAVNDQIAKSEIGKRILQGETDTRIVAWLRHSPEGRALRRRLPVRGSDPARWVQEVRMHADHYLPAPELRALALDGQAKISHLNTAVGDVALRPEIHAESLASSTGTSVIGQRWDAMVQGYYRRLGATPTNVLSRHPHFATLYKNEMAGLVHSYPLAEREIIPHAEIELMQRKARERALQGVRHTLYDLSNSSNLAHTFRYVSPFYSAWQEALTRWGGLFMEDPSRLARMTQLWEAPSKAGMVVTDPDTGRQSIVVNPPDWLLPKAIEGPIGIPKYWMRDLVAQGTYWMTPGVGAPVAIPIADLVRNRPDLYDNVKSVLPYGPGADTLDLMLPASARRLRSLHNKEDDAAYATAMVRIAQDLETDRQLALSHGQKVMSPAELMKETQRRTNQFFAVRTVANLLLPFSPTFKSPYDGYVQIAKNYRNSYLKMPGGKDPNGKTWEDRFLDEVGPEYFAFTANASKSTTGIAPTVAGYQAGRKFADLIAQAPEFGSLIVGPDAQTGDFSSAVYNAQFDQRVGPGSTAHSRERLSPEDALKTAQVDRGWSEYVRLSHTINRVMLSRINPNTGEPYKTLTGNGVRDLAVLKKLAVAKLAEKYPAWDEERNNITLDNTSKLIGFLKQNLDDPRFANRPGFNTLRQYMSARQTIQAVLDKRYAAGGQSTLGAKENADLNVLWDALVGNWKEKDVAFEALHTRWLQRDLGLKPPEDTATGAAA